MKEQGSSESQTASAEGQAVCDLIAAPYNEHLGALAVLADRASVVAALSPSRLAAVMRDGVGLALEAYGLRLAPKTKALIAAWLHHHVGLADTLSASWEALSRGAAGEIVRGFRAGFSSPEAQAGTALGSLLGGVGSLAGGLLGTFLALHRDDQSFAAKLQAHLREVDRWFTTAAADFDGRILPLVERDFNPWALRLRWAVGAVLALAGLGAAAWLAH